MIRENPTKALRATEKTAAPYAWRCVEKIVGEMTWVRRTGLTS